MARAFTTWTRWHRKVYLITSCVLSWCPFQSIALGVWRNFNWNLNKKWDSLRLAHEPVPRKWLNQWCFLDILWCSFLGFIIQFVISSEADDEKPNIIKRYSIEIDKARQIMKSALSLSSKIFDLLPVSRRVLVYPAWINGKDGRIANNSNDINKFQMDIIIITMNDQYFFSFHSISNFFFCRNCTLEWTCPRLCQRQCPRHRGRAFAFPLRKKKEIKETGEKK